MGMSSESSASGFVPSPTKPPFFDICVSAPRFDIVKVEVWYVCGVNLKFVELADLYREVAEKEL